MSFNPEAYLTDLKGKKYLEVRYRILWFRSEHPTGSISTEVLSMDGGAVLVRAVITDGDGKITATGHGSATDAGNAVWRGRAVEKAETAAIGRALGHAGYGTQFALTVDDDEGDHLADSPEPPRPSAKLAVSVGWTQSEQASFWKHHTDVLGIAPADILAALNVKKLGEWRGTISEAGMKVAAAQKAKVAF